MVTTENQTEPNKDDLEFENDPDYNTGKSAASNRVLVDREKKEVGSRLISESKLVRLPSGD